MCWESSHSIMPACPWHDVNEIPICSLSLAVSSTAHACVFMWNESLMPVVHDASKPSYILTLPGFPCSFTYQYIPNAYKTYWIMITTVGFLHPWAPVNLWYFPTFSVWFSVSQLSFVSLWVANLSEFPMMPWKSVSRATSVYQILSQRLLSCVSFVCTFHISVNI